MSQTNSAAENLSARRRSRSHAQWVWLASCLLHAAILGLVSIWQLGPQKGSGGGGEQNPLEAAFLAAGVGDDAGGRSSSGVTELAPGEPSFTVASEFDRFQFEEPEPPFETQGNPDPPRQNSRKISRPTAIKPAPTNVPSETVTEAASDPPARQAPRANSPIRQVSASSTIPAAEAAPRGRPRGVLKAGRPGRGKGAKRGGLTGTFFGAEGHGTKFVFVVDRSDSMVYRDRLKVALAEVEASLAELPAEARVQVVLYNEEPLSLESAEGQSLLNNSEAQRRKLSQLMSGTPPQGGTDHLRALRFALGLKPDVIFLLTDADEPKLTSADLEQLRRANRQQTVIHAIELGIGPLLERDNFLMRLALSNSGEHRYVDVLEVLATVGAQEP